ncbi:MAG TPA: biliverdin-producing heme oxygenase [Actinomycetota bacterium]|nr:biliverdin-producing heme oxygenase [Actinomycetota bacterium]
MLAFPASQGEQVMSKILKRVEEASTRLGEKVDEAIATKPFSRVMRRESWGDHQRAEYSPFEQSLVKATVSKEGYADLLAQTWYIYDALETKTEQMLDDPVASRVIFKDLYRREHVAADAAFFAGPDWKGTYPILPVVQEYCDRINNASPAQFVAHHYVRYMADLSGGLFIAAALRDAWKLNGEGLTYYDFAEIGDAAEFKQQYRSILDDLPVDAATKKLIIEEVMVAYEYNIELATLLGDKHLVAAQA